MEQRFRTILIQLLSNSLGLCVMSMGGLAVLQVALRYIFSSPLIWVEEISVMIMLWMTWLGISLLWVSQSHIVVDIFTSHFSHRLQRALASLIDVIAVIAAVSLLIVSRETLKAMAGMELDSLAVDVAIKYYPIPVGAVGLGLAALLDLWSWYQAKEAGQ
jgi:TRAP-type C4-dicarboxylate transport system permease small subunit